jgi:hypothetical protein
MCTTTKTHVISAEALKNVISNEKNNKGGIFTIKSKATGKDFTYKIKRSEFKGIWYTHIFVEQHYLEFKHIGTYFRGRIYKKGGEVTTPAAIGISWILSKVEKGMYDWCNQQAEIMHAGSCILCGKTLTDAESIERGLGPVCAG